VGGLGVGWGGWGREFVEPLNDGCTGCEILGRVLQAQPHQSTTITAAAVARPSPTPRDDALGHALLGAEGGHCEHPDGPHTHQPRDGGVICGEDDVEREEAADDQRDPGLDLKHLGSG